MATLEILGEPKELNLTQGKNILVNQDYSQTINNEFNKVLQEAGNNGNSYEKRLEKLNEQTSTSFSQTSFNVNNSQNVYGQEQIQEYKAGSQESSKTYEKNNTETDKNARNSSNENTVSSNDQASSDQEKEKVLNKRDSENNHQYRGRHNPESNTGNIDARMQTALLNATITTQNRTQHHQVRQNKNEVGQTAPIRNNYSARESDRNSAQNIKGQTYNNNGSNNVTKYLSNNNTSALKQDNNTFSARTVSNHNQIDRTKNTNQNQNIHQHVAAKAQNNANNTGNQQNKVDTSSQNLPENLQKLLKDEKVTVTVNSQDETQQQVHNKTKNINDKNKSYAGKLAAKLDAGDDAKALTAKLNLQQNSAETDLKDQGKQESGEQILLKSDNSQLYNGQVEVSAFKPASFDGILDINQSKQAVNTSVIDQIAQKTNELSQSNNSNITIALNPENLGKVEINLVSQNGTLTAQITTENAQVKDELTKGLEDLKQNLINQGINVDKLVVNVQEPSTSNNNYSNMHHDQGFQGFEQPKPDLSNYRQTSYQESSSTYTSASSNVSSTEDEGSSSGTVSNDNYLNPERALPGRVDYII